jgi:hypothetical protein
VLLVAVLIVYVSCLAKTLEVSMTLSVHYADTRAVDINDINNIRTLSRSVVTAETNTTNDHEDEQSRHFLTQNSTSLPAWFKDYSISHREQRSALNETNWKNQRFLIMRCLDFDEKCGGASDRLQSIPAMLMLANQTGRMFFIKWSRPAPLQEFLVPPTGGLDWTIPDWLDSQLDFRKLPARKTMKRAYSNLSSANCHCYCRGPHRRYGTLAYRSRH